MSCDCIEQIDAKLAERNSKLQIGFTFGAPDRPGYTFPALTTEKIAQAQSRQHWARSRPFARSAARSIARKPPSPRGPPDDRAQRDEGGASDVGPEAIGKTQRRAAPEAITPADSDGFHSYPREAASRRQQACELRRGIRRRPCRHSPRHLGGRVMARIISKSNFRVEVYPAIQATSAASSSAAWLSTLRSRNPLARRSPSRSGVMLMG